MKKTPGDFIILHICTKNYEDMMHCFPDMVCNGRIDRKMDGQKSGI